MCKFVTPHLMHLMSVSFVNYFFAGSVCTKECKFLPKCADKRKRTIQTFVGVFYISSLWPKLLSLNVRLSCPLSCGISELVEHSTPNNNSKTIQAYNRKQVSKSSFKQLDVIKIKNRSAPKALDEEFQILKNYETSFHIVTQIFAVDLDFDRCSVGSDKQSSCFGGHVRASLNQL